MFEGGGCTELGEMLMEEKPTSRFSNRENAGMCTSASQYLPAGPTEAFGW